MLLTVEPLPGLEVDASTPLTKELCVCEDSSPSYYELHVKVSDKAEVGDLNVTVTATNSENLSVCGDKPSQSVTSRDRITRQLKIIPEGNYVHEFLMNIINTAPSETESSDSHRPFRLHDGNCRKSSPLREGRRCDG